MATATSIKLVPVNRTNLPRIDYLEKCRCGHYRYEHNQSFGCMQWDERRAKGWCDCDGFATRGLFI